MSLTTARILCACLCLTPFVAPCKEGNYKQAKKTVEQSLQKLRPSRATAYSFRQTKKILGHLSKPWATSEYKTAGNLTFVPANNALYIADSLYYGKRTYDGYRYYSNHTMAEKDYGQKALSKITQEEHENYIYDAAMYSPVYLLHHFLQQPKGQFISYHKGQEDTITYRHADRTISLTIQPNTQYLTGAAILSASDMYGDVTETIHYQGYRTTGQTAWPAHISNTAYNMLMNEVSLDEKTALPDTGIITALVPAGYTLEKNEQEQPNNEITLTKYNSQIYLLQVKDGDEQCLVVDFGDYFAVSGAPLKPENGQRMLRLLDSLFPGKPVQYFLFGHHHPHYIGGVRAFIHAGATILSVPSDTAYINQLAAFPHTLRPDALQAQPKAPRIQIVESQATLSHNGLEMQVIHIGKMSAHTEDYLIYYFPQYKLLWNDDLVWISKDKPLSKAGARQQGLYDAIIQYGLKVDTILQSWPVTEHNAKTIIPFSELEASAKME